LFRSRDVPCLALLPPRLHTCLLSSLPFLSSCQATPPATLPVPSFTTSFTYGLSGCLPTSLSRWFFPVFHLPAWSSLFPNWLMQMKSLIHFRPLTSICNICYYSIISSLRSSSSWQTVPLTSPLLHRPRCEEAGPSIPSPKHSNSQLGCC